MLRHRVLPIVLAAAAAFGGCKSSSQPPAYKGEGRLIAEGPAREVITSPDGATVAWLADPNLAREKGVNASDQVYVGTARMAPATGGAPITLGEGVATLPGTFFFSPSGKSLGALIGWSFPTSSGSLVIADTGTGQVRKVADGVTYFAFSADGSQLGYVADRVLRVQPTAGGEPREIAQGIGTFEFAPGGKSLVARQRTLRGGELLRFDLTAEKPSAVVLGEEVGDYAFSPDGSRLAFSARNEKGGADLFLAEGNGKPVKLGEGVPAFRFSPDGKSLAFLGDVAPQKQFGDLYLLAPGAAKPRKIGITVTEFAFDPTSKRIAWLDKYSPQSRGGNLTWIDVGSEAEAKKVASSVPSFVWDHAGDALAYVARITSPQFSIDLFLQRIGKDDKPVKIAQGVFGYSFTRKDDRLLFRTECTRNARSCELHAVSVAQPTEPARKLASGIFTYELDPANESLVMITYARTDADAVDLAAAPADGSAPPRTLDRMVARGTKFVGGDQDRIAYAVLDQKRMGVYVADAPDFSAPAPVAGQQ